MMKDTLKAIISVKEINTKFTMEGVRASMKLEDGALNLESKNQIHGEAALKIMTRYRGFRIVENGKNDDYFSVNVK